MEKLQFRQIEPVSLAERAANALKDAFFSGQLKPGDAIVERATARQMKVATVVVREALISLQEQGFVRRVANTGTFVTEFDAAELRQICTLRLELELLAFQWARTRVNDEYLAELRQIVRKMVEAGEADNRREFLERDYSFHQRCWQLSGNVYLNDVLRRLTAPLFAFVVMSSCTPVTNCTAREYEELIQALCNLQEPEFSSTVRRILTGITLQWLPVCFETALPTQ
jgi:DNA-binding GntR family transcriptional regulator